MPQGSLKERPLVCCPCLGEEDLANDWHQVPRLEVRPFFHLSKWQTQKVAVLSLIVNHTVRHHFTPAMLSKS